MYFLTPQVYVLFSLEVRHAENFCVLKPGTLYMEGRCCFIKSHSNLLSGSRGMEGTFQRKYEVHIPKEAMENGIWEVINEAETMKYIILVLERKETPVFQPQVTDLCS
jgi:hypothetical protein